MRKTFLALLLAASVTPAFAQDKTVNLKVSLWVPPAHPLVPATQAWAADIEKASGGTIKCTVFPSEQLGKAFDHYDMARDGIADITYVNPGYQPGRFPIAAAGQLPFVFSDGKKGTLALNEWYHKYAPTEMKDTKLCFAFIHDPGALHGKKKILVPERSQGREGAPGAEHHRRNGEDVRRHQRAGLGAGSRATRSSAASPTRSPSPGARCSCSASTRSVKYHMDVPLYTTVFTYNMNLDKYNSMSDAQKKVIDDHCTPEWAAEGHRSLDRIRSQRPRQDEGVARSRGLSADAGPARASGRRRSSRCTTAGPKR